MQTRTRNVLGQLLTLHIPLIPFILFALFPFYFMVITSFKADGELYNLKANPCVIQLSPTHPDYSGGPTLEHYQLLLRDTPFLTWLFNSVLVSVLATAISIVIAILAAYSLARLRFRGAPSFGTAVFITYLVPTTLLFLPLAQVVNRLGLADSVWALILTYPTFLVPFCTWLLLGYFRTIPQEIEECATVDGCTRFQALHQNCAPGGNPRHRVRGALRLYDLLERVHLCLDIHLLDGPEDHYRGRDGGADPGRHFLLGLPNGWGRPGLDPHRACLRSVYGLLRLWPHSGGDQVSA